jgi:DUF1009 family protein
MRLEINPTTIVVIKEDVDKKIYSDSTLLRHVARKLNEQGFDVIKKLAYKDGNMVSDDMSYIRSRKYKSKDAFCAYYALHNIRCAYKDFNDGELILSKMNLNY